LVKKKSETTDNKVRIIISNSSGMSGNLLTNLSLYRLFVGST
jgi:hypothetical protein